MNTSATHLLVELHGCDNVLLNDADFIDSLMGKAILAAGATEISRMVSRFVPQGVAALYLLAESHFSFHSWPELGYAALDFYTCGKCEPSNAVRLVSTGVKARRIDRIWIERGRNVGPLSLRILDISSRTLRSSSIRKTKTSLVREGKRGHCFATVDT